MYNEYFSSAMKQISTKYFHTHRETKKLNKSNVSNNSRLLLQLPIVHQLIDEDAKNTIDRNTM